MRAVVQPSYADQQYGSNELGCQSPEASTRRKRPVNLHADSLGCNPIPLYLLKELQLRFLIVVGCRWLASFGWPQVSRVVCW